MHFEHIRILWLLAVIPLIAFLYGLKRHRSMRRMKTFASERMLGRIQPDVSRRRPVIKIALLCTALGMLIVAWANPLSGTEIAEGEQRGIDMAICMDVSNSMLAEDMKPDRMEKSKQVVMNLLNRLGGDRVSLVIFAGHAYIQMPLTNDYGATKMFLSQISTDLISEQGTAIGDAIEKGMATLGYGADGSEDEAAWEPNRSRAIVVISDGENHEDDAVDAAKQAAKQGIMVCTIGIGSPNGAQIPEKDNNGFTIDWRHDSEGKVVTTRLNEDMLREVAKAGNGVYAHANNSNAATETVLKQIATLDSQKFGAAMFSAYKSNYQYPLGIGLALLLAELLIFERRNPRININKMIRRKKV